MKIEIEVPDSALGAVVRQAALDALFENRGYSSERLSPPVRKLVAERTLKAFDMVDLSAIIADVMERSARETLETEVRKVMAKMARDAVKAEMDKQGKFI